MSQLLNEIVDIEIDVQARLILTGIGCRPGNVGHAMIGIQGSDTDIAYPHFLRPYRSIARIALRHDLRELVVVLPCDHSGGRGCDEFGGI